MSSSSTLELLADRVRTLRETLLALQKLSHAQAHLLQSAQIEEISVFTREKKSVGNQLQSVVADINKNMAYIQKNGSSDDKKNLDTLIQQMHQQCQPLFEDIERVEKNDMTLIQSMRSDSLAEISDVMQAQDKLKVIRAGYSKLDSLDSQMFDRQG
jgi:hypothetical protein